MDMSPDQVPRPPRALAPCPWCGPGTSVTVRGDGRGAQALCCLKCGASGPKAQIAADQPDASAAAVGAWSARRVEEPVSMDTIRRVRTAVGLHCITGHLTPDAAVSVAWADLEVLLRSAQRSVVRQDHATTPSR